MSKDNSSYKESWLYRRGRLWLVSIVVLLVAGFVMLPLQKRVWPVIRASQPELNLTQIEGALGQGVVIGLLGGFRTLLADIVFLRANYFWEKKDRAATEALINLTTAIDPRPMFFWQNGSRIIAYDIPIWRIREAGDFENISDADSDRIYNEQAERGMAMMRRAALYHPDDYRVPLEIAQIYNNKLKNEEKAAEYYLKAWEMPNAPYYTARIHAELLRRLDKKREAYDFLRGLYAKASADSDPRANQPVILDRIRELERELNLPNFDRLTQQPGEHFPQMHVDWNKMPDFGLRPQVMPETAPLKPFEDDFVPTPPPPAAEPATAAPAAADAADVSIPAETSVVAPTTQK